MKGIKESILKMNDYLVPQSPYPAKLNQNESPYDPPRALKRKICDQLMEKNWNRYPSCLSENLIKKISLYSHFPVKGILVGNSSNEIIQALIHAICADNDSLLLVKPSFSIYRRIASIVNVNLVEVPLLNDFSFDVATMLKKAKHVKMVIFPNPNNPTGTVIQIEAIQEIARICQGFVVIDEAYYEFYGKTAKNLIREFKNVVIVRTFSKAMGIAGLRLGYALGNSQLIRELSKAKLPFSVGTMQQTAGEVILDHPDVIASQVSRIQQEKERVCNVLNKTSHIETIPSFTNFILFRYRNKTAHELFGFFCKNGILLRTFELPELSNWLRVTIGTPRENDMFLKALSKFMEKR